MIITCRPPRPRRRPNACSRCCRCCSRRASGRGSRLAERLQVSERTVRRDVERLRELGYRIDGTKGRDGGYRLDAGTALPPMLFDDEQAVAIAIALKTATGTGAGIAESAGRALSTMRQVLPRRLSTRIDSLEVSAAGNGHGEVGTDVILAVDAAIRASEELRFDYRRAGEDFDDDAAPPAHAAPPSSRRLVGSVVCGGLESAIPGLANVSCRSRPPAGAERSTVRPARDPPRRRRRKVPRGAVQGVDRGRRVALSWRSDPSPRRPGRGVLSHRCRGRAPPRPPREVPRSTGIFLLGRALRFTGAFRCRCGRRGPGRAAERIRDAGRAVIESRRNGSGTVSVSSKRSDRTGRYAVLCPGGDRPASGHSIIGLTVFGPSTALPPPRVHR